MFSVVFRLWRISGSPEFSHHADYARGVYQIRSQAHQTEFSDDQRQDDRQVKRRQVGRDRQVVVRFDGPAVVRKTCKILSKSYNGICIGGKNYVHNR